jgi:hypothetical protein
MMSVGLVFVALACDGGNSAPGNDGDDSSGGAGQGPRPDEKPIDPGTPIDVPVVTSDDVESVQALLDDAAGVDLPTLRQRSAIEFESELGYDAMSATGIDALQASNLALVEPEQALLQQNGFAILARHEFPSFFYAYLTIYGEDLPVFVSADSVLDAVHRSFDDILAALERAVMVPELGALLTEMRARVSGLSGQTAADAELYLAVAQGLLERRVPSDLAAGVQSADVEEFLDAATDAQGIINKTLFGVPRRMDFSQFKPRGHYEGDELLEPYFRAMMWLGRIDFRMLETQDDGSQVFHRRQLEAALALRELMDAQARARWDRLDAIVSAFVGEHDYMILPELEALLADLGVSDLEGLASLDDAAIAGAITAGGYGVQRISSHVMVNGGGVATLPLSRSFAFFGQRYTVDSHVFSNLVYDRVGKGAIPRWLPDPLDAAFAALGNDQAVSLLQAELDLYPYAPDLAAMRALVDAHPTEYWESSLYTLWLGALRTLSPKAEGNGRAAEGLPSVARTEGWGRRILNTQLGSWSQLRHDTLLYAKQSYTVGTVCEFPDAYVDPYPQLFGAIRRFAERGEALVGELDLAGDQASWAQSVQPYFATLADVAGTLEAMAEHQRTGMPHSAEHLAFINEVVNVAGGGSGPPSVTGWYARLFFDRQRALEQDPIIADVHTDVGGVERPAKVLHVATGLPRAMVVTVDTCVGPRVYVGPAFAYHEERVDGVVRRTDSQWAAQIEANRPADVPWMSTVVAR